MQVVGRAARKAVPKLTSVPRAAAGAAAHQHRHSQQHGQKPCKRCPSLVSLTESSGTAESMESDQSFLSAATAHHHTGQPRPPISAGKQRGLPGPHAPAAAHGASKVRADTPPEAHGPPAAPAVGQTWAGRVAGTMPTSQQQKGGKDRGQASGTATSGLQLGNAPHCVETGKNAHLYIIQDQHAGMTSQQLEASLSPAAAMYHSSPRAVGPAPAAWETSQHQQSDISAIPEDAASSNPDCTPHRYTEGLASHMNARSSGQSCCAAARAQSEASAAKAIAAKQEASSLRAELQLLRAAMQRVKTAHQQELAQLLQSAACHQAQVLVCQSISQAICCLLATLYNGTCCPTLCALHLSSPECSSSQERIIIVLTTCCHSSRRSA